MESEEQLEHIISEGLATQTKEAANNQVNLEAELASSPEPAPEDETKSEADSAEYHGPDAKTPKCHFPDFPDQSSVEGF